MDLGRVPLARFPSGDEEIAQEPITTADLESAVAQVGAFGSDNRAGINETLHRISCMRNRAGGVVGLTCRVGRSIPGSAAMIVDLAVAGFSLLLLGPPGTRTAPLMMQDACTQCSEKYMLPATTQTTTAQSRALRLNCLP